MKCQNEKTPSVGFHPNRVEVIGVGIVAVLVANDVEQNSIQTKSKPIPIMCSTSVVDETVASNNIMQRFADDTFALQQYFLNFCYLCRKNLSGRDIFMYRGEKAFCSVECRSEQILSDEHLKKYGLEASPKSFDMYSVSPLFLKLVL